MKSFSGCWTCRLRRKKCDENRPVCNTCAALHITCFYNQDRPEWMDGGPKQEEMAKRFKIEVKENFHHRRADRTVDIADGHNSSGEATGNQLSSSPATLPCNILEATTKLGDGEYLAASIPSRRALDRAIPSEDTRAGITFERSDTILLTFYLESLFPFLFPFYRPSPLQGGKAWIMEMMVRSPVVRQATLCQSSYFFSLAQGAKCGDAICKTVLMKTQDAFEMLRQAIQVICDSNITDHIHGAVRIMTSIIQVLRFEVAILSFENCHVHLNAALAIFKQLFNASGAAEPVAGFETLMDWLRSSKGTVPPYCAHIPSAEQIAFRFSSSLLILDDIIASTTLQQQPVLYNYHRSLLSDIGGFDPTIDLEAVVGCQNWVFLQIGEIAALDAWKQECTRDGNLDIIELARRAVTIKDSLEANFTRLLTDPVSIVKEGESLLNVFIECQQPQFSTTRNRWMTQVWAHAALLYLSVVVSGWQPANADVRYHVGQIIDILTCQVSPIGLLRTLVWPFCVAGCLAEQTQEPYFRKMVEALQPPHVFVTVHKALDMMENVWRDRHSRDFASRSLAACFRSQEDLVLLV